MCAFPVSPGLNLFASVRDLCVHPAPMHSVRGELCFAETQYLKTLWVETSLRLSKVDQNATAQNKNATFSEWNALTKQTGVFCGMGSLGTPGDFVNSR